MSYYSERIAEANQGSGQSDASSVKRKNLSEIMMHEKPTRAQIVAAADQLFYRQGYADTSFTDIAAAVQISRGNFYHHFKTKDEILDAVIQRRLEYTQQMLAQWEHANPAPEARIRCFIEILIENRAQIKRYGCPVGTLCTELAKLSHPAQLGAKQLFTLFRGWLRRQFDALGQGAQADALAMHVLAMSQGVATLANTFHDEKFLRQEVERMTAWLHALAQETPQQ